MHYIRPSALRLCRISVDSRGRGLDKISQPIVVEFGRSFPVDLENPGLPGEKTNR